ncbi:unnamed protein product [Protopolystoma xenopodis]|uniref:Uncharacterized protein n=1 Tax=Protopolystoma xenopodis TaxID=117903 RepID=A0A3S4ZU89_9PLAT|nr:unnamed protein product [Protopolystoma xenopodis]
MKRSLLLASSSSGSSSDLHSSLVPSSPSSFFGLLSYRAFNQTSTQFHYAFLGPLMSQSTLIVQSSESVLSYPFQLFQAASGIVVVVAWLFSSYPSPIQVISLLCRFASATSWPWQQTLLAVLKKNTWRHIYLF